MPSKKATATNIITETVATHGVSGDPSFDWGAANQTVPEYRAVDTPLLRAIHNTPWAILPEKLEAICEVVRRHAASALPPTQFAAAHPRRRASGSVAVLPLYGTISQRMGMMESMSGGTSAEAFGKYFRAAVADPDVGSIVIDIDSPGGSVYGIEELASEILDARGEKQIVAVANSLAASAAYWIGSAAHEFVVTPSGEVGSIGVPPAVINAVVDAVAHLGITHIEMPAKPERVWRAIRDAQATT